MPTIEPGKAQHMMHQPSLRDSDGRRCRKSVCGAYVAPRAKELDMPQVQDFESMYKSIVALPSPPLSPVTIVSTSQQGRRCFSCRTGTYQRSTDLPPRPSPAFEMVNPHARSCYLKTRSASPLLRPAPSDVPIPDVESADYYMPPRDQDWILYPGTSPSKDSQADLSRVDGTDESINLGVRKFANELPVHELNTDTDQIGHHSVLKRTARDLPSTTPHLIQSSGSPITNRNGRQEMYLDSEMKCQDDPCQSCLAGHSNRTIPILQTGMEPILPPKPTIPRLKTPDLLDVGPEQWF